MDNGGRNLPQKSLQRMELTIYIYYYKGRYITLISYQNIYGQLLMVLSGATESQYICINKALACPFSANYIGVVALHRQGYAVSTISTHMATLSYIHKLNDWPDPSASFLMKSLMNAVKKDARGQEPSYKLPFLCCMSYLAMYSSSFLVLMTKQCIMHCSCCNSILVPELVTGHIRPEHTQRVTIRSGRVSKKTPKWQTEAYAGFHVLQTQ